MPQVAGRSGGCIVITEPHFGEETRRAALEARVGDEVLTVPFVLSEAQRQLRRSARVAEDVLATEPDPGDDLRRALAGADIVVGQDFPIDMRTLAPNVRFLQVLSSGVDHLRVCRLPEDVKMANGAGLAAESVAEWVVAQILAHLKGLRTLWAQQQVREWRPQHGSRLSGKHVVVVGYGAIGQAVAQATAGFGARVSAVRRRIDDGGEPSVRMVPMEAWRQTLATADVVVSALPDGAGTRDLFDRTTFEAMAPGCFYVNVGRGSAVVERDLIEQLARGHLSGAALDVFREEPLPSDSPLWTAPRLTVSPHSAVSFDGYTERAFDLLIDNVERVRSGRDPRGQVTPAPGVEAPAPQSMARPRSGAASHSGSHERTQHHPHRPTTNWSTRGEH